MGTWLPNIWLKGPLFLDFGPSSRLYFFPEPAHSKIQRNVQIVCHRALCIIESSKISFGLIGVDGHGGVQSECTARRVLLPLIFF